MIHAFVLGCFAVKSGTPCPKNQLPLMILMLFILIPEIHPGMLKKTIEEKLKHSLPNKPWSVKNQARMHQKSGFKPFKSSYDGVAHFPETPTAIAVRIFSGELEIIAPYGLDDLFEKRVKPTQYYKKSRIIILSMLKGFSVKIDKNIGMT